MQPLGVTMIKQLISAAVFGCTFWACDSSTPPDYIGGDTTPTSSTSSKTNVVPVDYSLGRAMNVRLGRGINLGNSWDSDGYDDGAWSNSIRDSDFKTIKEAGFNSVRIPVRWQNNSDYSTHTVDPNRLNGVLKHIRLAIANGLAVVVNFHHYVELNCAGGGNRWNPETGRNELCPYDETKFNEEKAHFLGMWKQVATAMKEFSDDMVVLEILNEPTFAKTDVLNQLMNEAYTVIHEAAPGKTIMFEANHYAKFADLPTMKLPPDGNIIFSGHYYEPYLFSHQGSHGNQCRGDAAYTNTASGDMAYYKSLARQSYPDINNNDNIPLNMGEFGVAGGSFMGECVYYDSKGNPNPGVWPSDQKKAAWAQMTAQAAINNGMSFHYWGFTQTGGFEAYDYYKNVWYPGFPDALLK